MGDRRRSRYVTEPINWVNIRYTHVYCSRKSKHLSPAAQTRLIGRFVADVIGHSAGSAHNVR